MTSLGFFSKTCLIAWSRCSLIRKSHPVDRSMASPAINPNFCPSFVTLGGLYISVMSIFRRLCTMSESPMSMRSASILLSSSCWSLVWVLRLFGSVSSSSGLRFGASAPPWLLPIGSPALAESWCPSPSASCSPPPGSSAFTFFSICSASFLSSLSFSICSCSCPSSSPPMASSILNRHVSVCKCPACAIPAC